jgi:FAD/FMN-containing dehydrogenase
MSDANNPSDRVDRDAAERASAERDSAERDRYRPGGAQRAAVNRTRRAFLVGAGAVGAGAVAAGYLETMSQANAAARAARLVSSNRPIWLAGPQTTPTAADWAALQKAISTHHIVRPGQKGYGQAKELFEPQFDSLQPAGIAYCKYPGDVVDCLRFVTKFKMPVRARSGGHSYAGWSSVTGGLIVDVSDMNSFKVGNGTVQVGSGISLLDFYSDLAAHGLAVPGGSCPTVGIAGLALGGGVGVLSRIYGLTCDNLEAVQVVTANGHILNCDSTHFSDLLWASQGGGGGNFGVATSFTFRTHALRSLLTFFLTWPWSRAAQVVSGWQSWAPFAPDALWSNMHLSAGTGGAPGISVGGTYVGSAGALDAELTDLYHKVGAGPSSHFVVPRSFLNAMLYEAGCETIGLKACHTGSGGVLPRVPSYAKSDFFTRKLDSAGIRTMLAGIEKLASVRGASGGAGTIALDACGGAISRVKPSATAFVHRDSLYLAQYSTVWTWPGSSAGVTNQRNWLNAYYKSLHPYASGQAYQNYIDPDLTDWEAAYYEGNYKRLQQVKAKYDPTDLFTFPQSIRPS